MLWLAFTILPTIPLNLFSPAVQIMVLSYVPGGIIPHSLCSLHWQGIVSATLYTNIFSGHNQNMGLLMQTCSVPPKPTNSSLNSTDMQIGI